MRTPDRTRDKGRRWLVPETVQTSAMDCGPAALRSLLAGHGVSASYGRLREACQTDVDVVMHGAVLVKVAGLSAEPVHRVVLPVELRAALEEPAPRPARELLAAARCEGPVRVGLLVAAWRRPAAVWSARRR